MTTPAPTPPFVHLHCHSHYSLLDGASPIDKLVVRAKELGMNGLALTDHGNLHGALEFYQAAKKAGINPILGYEAYIAPESRFKKEVGGLKEGSYHLTLLAQNRTGFKNLVKLASAAYLEGFYFKPRIDRELLAAHSEGIICLSGCVSSEFSRMLLKGQSPDRAHLEEAKQIAAWFHRVFGDRYFIEIQNNGLEIQRQQMEGAVDVARQMGLPLVCTSDAHYVNREDAEAQDVLLCINTGKFRTDTNRMRMDTDQFYLRSPAEMHTSFAGYEEALRQSQTIADSVSIDLELGKRHFPNFTPPESKSPSDYLRELCIRGLKERYVDNPKRWGDGVGWSVAAAAEAHAKTGMETGQSVGLADSAHPTATAELAADVLERLERELDVINQLGFPNYFLIVWDFVRYARERGIPATARGSGVGALVSYALYLSHVCPLEYDLLFERFLDISRLEAPDIDIDFCKDRRGEVINYVKEKYGHDNVAQIGTFGTLAARAAIRDVGRALGIPIPQVDKIVALVPDELGIELAEALEKSADLKRAYDSDPQTRELLNLAMKIEGLARNLGTHAAAVVIADQPLVEYVPLCRVKDKEETITQWSMGDVERAGLLKMDMLGLRNLTVLSKAVELIEQTTGRRIDPYKFALDDQPTFDLLCRGETKGIFQLESGGIRDLLTKMKPDHFRDIIATNALYRPGPLEGGMVDDYVQVKHGRKQAQYIHPVMKDVLEETHGVMVYQEQVMRILNKLGGIELPNAYTCIKAISKKKLETIAKFEEEFVRGATERGLKKNEAVELFEMIKKFAGYGFNKCVVGSTVIVDAQTGERTTVGDLFDRGRPFAVHALDERGKLRPRLVTDVVLNGRKRVFRVRTMLGNEFVATANHPLRRLNGWTTIDELRVGERIAAPRQMSIAGVTSWPRDEVIALAHLLAEGNTCHPTCLYFYNDSPELIDDFVAAIQQFPETVARIDRRADGRRMEVCVSTGRDARFQRRQVPWNKSVAESGTDNATATAIASAVRSGAYHWAAGLDILNRKATEKFVPAAVFQLTDHDVALFLGRLWSGDGYVARKQQMPYYATSSLQLARDVRFLLLRLGIVSRLTRKIFKYRYQGRVSERPGYTVHVVGADSLQAFLKLVTPHIIGRATEIAQLHEYRATLRSGLTSKDTIPAAVRAWVNEERVRHGLKWRDLEVQSGVCIRELCTSKNPLKRGFRRATIHKLADFFDSARLRDIAQSDIYWDTVVSIEPLGLEDTYDLTVEKDHNFVADGLVVHNSHSTAYALIAYMTAYLKTHFACEFMAALLSGDITGRNFKKKDSLVEHLEDCRRMGLEVLPPDVNSSDVDFGVRVEVGDSVALLAASSGTDPLPSTEAASRSITFGLSAIKGCGGQAAAALVVERKKNGVYRDLFDFCERVDPALCNRATIESLIKAGAFDFAGARRAQLMAVLDRAMQTGAALLADRKSGQKGLFDDADEGPTVRVQSLPDLPEWDEKEKLACEKEVLGFYLTSHPLAEHAETLASYCSHNTAAVATLPGRSEVVMGGMIGAIKHSQTKNPRAGETNTRYAMFDLEDMEGMIRCILWPSDFVNYGHLVADGAIVALRGSIDRRPGSDEANLIVNEIFPLSELAQRFTRGVRVRLDEQQHGERAMDSLHEILRGYPGTCEVELALVLADGAKLLLKCNSPKIQLSVELRTRLDDLLGPGNVKLIAAPPSTREPGTRGNGNGIQHRASNGVQRRMASV